MAVDLHGLARAAEVLRGRRITVLTGAGVSTDSGIPDYRGPTSVRRNPMTYQEFVGSADARRRYWARNHVGWEHMRRAQPNSGHRALAAMERDGRLAGLVTQNVDRLHEDAGSRNVIDLHGRYDRVVCLRCPTIFTRAAIGLRLSALNPGYADEHADAADVAPDADAEIAATAGFRFPDCPACGGVLKPDFVYFGESVPPERVAAAYDMVNDGDALLVAGSSLAVMSGLRFVRHAAKGGKPVVIVNRGATRGDGLATLKIEQGTSEVLSAIARL